MMSEKVEQIKELQKELFIEEHGVTKEQAIKLNQFLFKESTGREFDFWSGGEIQKPSVSTYIQRLEKNIEEQNKQLSELEWEHKKLWIGSTLFGIGVVAVTVVVAIGYFVR